MKVSKIEEIGKGFNMIYTVTLTPNWLENIFGIKEKTMRFKDSGRIYTVGGQTIYIREDGVNTENGCYIAKAIDKWRKSF